ncbi:unnamed protein product [Sphenostylis stenocarpa]|uniref:Uncharacterized protein n=1 Tax=Sphenostylis stenocarpa TaxID=92480 RepID=A0AA86TKX7_9FABA|nr:unnamed protein product [Sphenostylis stenocarpa]
MFLHSLILKTNSLRGKVVSSSSFARLTLKKKQKFASLGLLMAFQPKTEPGSPLRSFSTTHKKNYSEMSISELVSVLRVAYQMKDFDKVEEELVNREVKFRAEIGSLREKIEVERLKGIETEERLKIREEQYEKGKRAQENYEQLLKDVKKNGLVEKNTIGELRKKTIRALEEQKVGDKSGLDVLNMKNIGLEETVKKNLNVIEALRTENDKLKDEMHERKTLFESLERKYSELSVSVAKLEDDIKLLMSEGASNCGNTEVEPNPGVSYVVKDEEDVGDYELENDTGEPVPFQRNEDTRHSPDTGIAQAPPYKRNKDDALRASDYCGLVIYLGSLNHNDLMREGNGYWRETCFSRLIEMVWCLHARKPKVDFPFLSQAKHNIVPVVFLRSSTHGVKFKLEKEVIDLVDDDDDDVVCTSQGLHSEKAISQIIAENERSQRVETIKRKRAFDTQTCTSTSASSADLFEIDRLPIKRSKTSIASSDVYSLPGQREIHTNISEIEEQLKLIEAFSLADLLLKFQPANEMECPLTDFGDMFVGGGETSSAVREMCQINGYDTI